MGWATFWEILSKTHLVTLAVGTLQDGTSASMFYCQLELGANGQVSGHEDMTEVEELAGSEGTYIQWTNVSIKPRKGSFQLTSEEKY
jgi:hypothetical protein